MSPRQAIAQARSYIGSDPTAALRRAEQTDQTIAQFMRGKTPQQACYELARQTGVPLAQIISMIGGRP